MRPLSTSERKILTAIEKHPGLLWYEVGLLVYPNAARVRVNIFGRQFKELCGRGLSLTYAAFFTLQQVGLVKKDKEHRYRAISARPVGE